MSIANRPRMSAASELQWRTALEFLRKILIWTADSQRLKPSERADIANLLRQFETKYRRLRLHQGKSSDALRSLPAGVVEALHELLDPESLHNPFRNDQTRWRAFVIFLILLRQGLRRGEMLLLPADAVKSGFDSTQQRVRYWMNVEENQYEPHDPRYYKPSIKNTNSIRRIPLNESTAIVIEKYAANYRGRPSHSFLLNSQFDLPLSHEALTKLFEKISKLMPSDAMQELKDRTGKTSITPHDLRHTCCVVRLNELLNRGDSMDEALQKLRAFFGWSRNSDMPRKYARAVFEDRYANVWSKVFDSRVETLRALPKTRL